VVPGQVRGSHPKQVSTDPLDFVIGASSSLPFCGLMLVFHATASVIFKLRQSYGDSNIFGVMASLKLGLCLVPYPLNFCFIWCSHLRLQLYIVEYEMRCMSFYKCVPLVH